MSPFEHGEVFVLDDGGEVGLGMACVISYGMGFQLSSCAVRVEH